MILNEMIGTDRKFIRTAAPQMFFLDMNEQCNLKCWFCYNGKSHPIKHGDKKTLIQIIDVMNNVGCKEVIYLGGEPTIAPYFFDVITYANNLGMKQCVITNGQIIDNIFADKLRMITDLEVGISIHSCHRETQDKISGVQGSYQRLKCAIEALEKVDVKWYSQTSLTKENYLELHELAAYLQTIGHPQRMDLSRMVCGTKIDDRFLTEKGYIEIFKQINNMNLSQIPVRIEAFPRCWLRMISDKYGMSYSKICSTVRPCYAWVGQISVNVYGDVRLCPTGGIVAGNLLQDDFSKIWSENEKIIKFKSFDWLPNQCSICNDFPYCAGACKMTNAMISPTPDKFIVNEEGYTNAVE